MEDSGYNSTTDKTSNGTRTVTSSLLQEQVHVASQEKQQSRFSQSGNQSVYAPSFPQYGVSVAASRDPALNSCGDVYGDYTQNPISVIMHARELTSSSNSGIAGDFAHNPISLVMPDIEERKITYFRHSGNAVAIASMSYGTLLASSGDQASNYRFDIPGGGTNVEATSALPEQPVEPVRAEAAILNSDQNAAASCGTNVEATSALPEQPVEPVRAEATILNSDQNAAASYFNQSPMSVVMPSRDQALRPNSVIAGEACASQRAEPGKRVDVEEATRSFGSLASGGKSIDGCVQCPHCEGIFPTTSSLSDHFRRTHNEPRNHVACEEEGCHSNFQTVKKLVEHDRNQHRGPKNMISCYACSNLFKTPEDHHRHVLKDHAHSADVHTCPLPKCDHLTFPNREQLAIHLTQSHIASDGAITCQMGQCKEKFSSATALFEHLPKAHFGFNGLYCDFPNCGAPFHEATSLRDHILTYHIALHKCPLSGCFARFDTAEQFQTHIGKCVQGRN